MQEVGQKFLPLPLPCRFPSPLAVWHPPHTVRPLHCAVGLLAPSSPPRRIIRPSPCTVWPSSPCYPAPSPHHLAPSSCHSAFPHHSALYPRHLATTPHRPTTSPYRPTLPLLSGLPSRAIWPSFLCYPALLLALSSSSLCRLISPYHSATSPCHPATSSCHSVLLLLSSDPPPHTIRPSFPHYLALLSAPSSPLPISFDLLSPFGPLPSLLATSQCFLATSSCRSTLLPLLSDPPPCIVRPSPHTIRPSSSRCPALLPAPSRSLSVSSGLPSPFGPLPCHSTTSSHCPVPSSPLPHIVRPSPRIVQPSLGAIRPSSSHCSALLPIPSGPLLLSSSIPSPFGPLPLPFGHLIVQSNPPFLAIWPSSSHHPTPSMHHLALLSMLSGLPSSFGPLPVPSVPSPSTELAMP